MKATPESSSKSDTGGKAAGGGFVSQRYFRLSVTALIFIAFAFGNFEYITGKHRPDPFKTIEPVTSWAWWRYPLPEESADVMPWPVGVDGKLIERGNYAKNHDVEIIPGAVSIKLGELEPAHELADFAPFIDGSAWALDAQGNIFKRPVDGKWQQHEINLIRQDELQQAAPRISGRELATIETNAPVVWAQFSPDGDTLVVLTEESEILGWSVSRGDWDWRRDVPPRRYSNLRFATNQPWVILSSRDGITIFNWIEAEIVEEIRSSKAPYTAAAVTPDGEIITWDFASGLQLWSKGKPQRRFDARVKDDVERIVTSPDGNFFAVSSRFEVLVFHFDSGKPVQSFISERGSLIQDFAFIAGGNRLIVRDELRVQVFNIDSGRIEGSWSPSQVLSWSPPNNIVLGLEGKGGLTLWQYQNDEFSSFPVSGGSMVAALSPAGDLIAAQADRGPVRVFGRREQGIATEIDYRGERSRQLLFNASGNVLMVLQENADISLWDVGLEVPPATVAQTQIQIVDLPVRSMQFLDSRTGWLISEDNQLLSTSNSGNTWKPIAVPELADSKSAQLNAAYFVSQLSGWVVGNNGLIVSTSDGGASWTRAQTPSNDDLYAVHFTNQDLGLAVGQAGTVLRSDDGGQSWSRVEILLDKDLRAVTLLADGAGWISTQNHDDQMPQMLETIDGGKTWKQIDFSELPAPLLLFIGIPLFSLAVFVVFYKRPQIVETAGVDPVGMSDKPIGWDDPDPLHFKPIAKGLSYFLRNQDTEPPLTIGINGPWGTGKSSLMNLLMEDLRLYGCSPVWFNAWHHQKEEHLLAALLENIRKQAVPKLWQRDGIMFRLRLLWLRTQAEIKMVTSLALVILGLVLLDQIFSDGRFQTAILRFNPASLDDLTGQLSSYLSAQTGAIGGILAFVVWLIFRLRVLPSNPAKLLVGLGNRANVGGFSDQLGFRYKFGGEFKEVCKALRSRNTPGLVILIDDLDRCQPQNVLEVLEAVNYLATVGDCFIILGMARRQVENCIAIGFKDFVVEGMEEQEHGFLQANNLHEAELVAVAARGIDAENSGELDRTDAVADPAPDGSSHATDNQRRFARHYLEKLVNIEVAVPRGNPDQAAGLFAPDKNSSDNDSRFRQRQLLHKATGLIQIAALVFLLGIVGAGVAPLLPQEKESEQLIQDQTKGVVPAKGSETPLVSAPENVINGPDEPVVAPKTGQATAATPLLSIAPVSHVSLTGERSAWTWWGPPMLVFATIMLFLIRRRLRPADNNIKDTQGFTEALKRWYPLIYAVNPTPRAVKRFENRIRYIAMQARPPQQTPDFIDRFIDWFENRWAQILRRKTPEIETETEVEAAAEYGIEDEMLVALGAVEALDPDTIKEKGSFEIEQLVLASTAELLEQMQATEPRDDDQFVAQLNKLNAYIEAGKDWPPKTQDLNDYRHLSGQIRG